MYRPNLRPRSLLAEHLQNLVDYDSETECRRTRPLVSELLSRRSARGVDVLLASPPCEGNSNLNNQTRRVDRRNELYVAAAAIAIGIEAQTVIMENVPEVTKAKQAVVPRATRMFQGFGYEILTDDLVLDASDYGTAQQRRRHFLVATRSKRPVASISCEELKVDSLSAMDAIGDLADVRSADTLDTPSRLSAENQARAGFLFAKPERYDLPNSERPDCHRHGHTYPSVYGRIYPDQPSQTITTGFLSPGRGRYVHPTRPRSLTPREGARLQGFPDDYQWLTQDGSMTRNALSHLIGDAVPPQLGFVAGLLALSTLS